MFKYILGHFGIRLCKQNQETPLQEDSLHRSCLLPAAVLSECKCLHLLGLYISRNFFLLNFFHFCCGKYEGYALGKEAKEIGEAIVVGSLQMLLEKDITVGRGGMVKKNLLNKESARICRTVNISSINLKTDGKIKSN